MKKLILLVLALFGIACSQKIYRFCAPDSIDESTCRSLSRENSQVSCIRVKDNADCAIKIHENKADFGIFNAEELLMTYQFFHTIVPVAQIKHRDRKDKDFEFQTVAVVPKSFNPYEGVSGLKNAGLCHPGFSESQKWNDNILKYLERSVFQHECRANVSVGENEAENLRNFFGKACRPGQWVLDDAYDIELKKKYPELCELCDDRVNCSYKNQTHHGHIGALECLTSGRGNVAYVAYHYVQSFIEGTKSHLNFVMNESFQFLCPNGDLQPLTASNPCGWINQPWTVVASRNNNANEMLENLKNWLTETLAIKGETWTVALNKIIHSDDFSSVVNYLPPSTDLKSYLVTGRKVDPPENLCGKKIRWCTVSTIETAKCNWVATEARLLGIEPQFTCRQTDSTFDCLQSISNNQTDIMTIDTNYGFLARKNYKLKTVLYAQTQRELSSIIIAVVRNDTKIKSFADLKGKVACFPNYGGLAWLSFIQTARQSKIISDNCNYPKEVSGLLSGACVPGVNDHNYEVNGNVSSDLISKLCSFCPMNNNNFNQTCSADESNEFFGDLGALKCLQKQGDIAFIEMKNIYKSIKDNTIDTNSFKILCKEGHLIDYSTERIDETCSLSATIDSEIVTRKNNSELDTLDVTHALLKIEDWLGYRAYARRPIRIYDEFDGYKDLLFKDSTEALVTLDTTIRNVKSYRDLFNFIESCSSDGLAIISNTFVVLISTLLLFMVYFK